RDLETIQTALTIAETGHLVLSTLHTNDAVQAVTRIVDVFPPHAQEAIRVQLSLALSAVVGQRLVRDRKGEHVLAAEVLMNTPAVANTIREARVEQLYSTMELDRTAGMQTLNAALQKLVDEKVILESEARRYRNTRESKSRSSRPAKPG
ncbi:MAG: Flp pilus assembly complex ATPase component TadA, partial [Myxococcales bacterium]|nr:Flp pilus assembly complex ATPase component TadA [Myxococcales bacterium]